MGILAGLSAIGVLLAALVASATPAAAQCQQSGTTVTCSGNGTGFQAGIGVNGLTVDVLPGAVASNPGAVVIGVNSLNTVTNGGTLNAGDDGIGIDAGNRNTITNAATGRINIGNAVATDAIGVRMGENNVFTNLGIIQVGSLAGCGCAPQVGGVLGGDRNTVSNGGTISGGDTAFGIIVNDRSTVVNGGTITMGLNGLGIGAGDLGAVTNAGTIAIGNAFAGEAIGIAVDDRGTVTNTGTIALGSTTFGFIAGIAAGSRNTVVNTGAITVGSSDPSNFGTVSGIFALDRNTIVNAGSITAGSFGFGINVGDRNQITNNGMVTVGAGALGGGFPLTAAIALGSDNELVNNGLVRAGANAASIGPACFCASDNLVVNNGTLDGQVALVGSGNILTNNGLITITDPGTLPGAVHFVGGDFIQGATGTLALRVTPDTTPFTYDSMLVTGTATLAGTLRATVQPGIYQATQTYLAVLAFCNCSTGTFGSVVSSSPFFTASATYNPDSVDLTLTRIAFGSVPGETLNQRRVGNYLESFYSTTLTGNAATFFGNLLAATSVGVLDSLSGEGTATTQQTALDTGDMFTRTMLDQMLAWLGGAPAGAVPGGAALSYAPSRPARPEYKAFAGIDAVQAQPWRAWATGFGGRQTLSGDIVVGSANANHRTFGASGGIAYQLGRDLLVGFAGAGSSSSFSVPGRATSGTIDGAHLGLYGIYRAGAAYLAGTLSYSHFDNSTTRIINGIGPSETATGSFGSHQFGGRLQAGYRFAFGSFAVTPFAAVQHLALRQSGYAEASVTVGGAPGLLGLNVQARAASSLPTFLGAQIDTRIAFAPGATLSPYLRAAWVHEFTPDRSITAGLGILPTGSFIVDGPRAARDAARLEAGANLQVNRRVTVFGSFVGDYAARVSSNAGNGGLRVTW